MEGKPTKEEQIKLEQEKAIAVDEAKAKHKIDVQTQQENRKKIEEMNKTHKAIEPDLKSLERLHDLLEKNKNLTGLGKATLEKIPYFKSNGDLGAFNAAATPLQGGLASQLTKGGHPGYGVLNIVSAAKPNASYSAAYNQQIIKELARHYKDTYKQMNEEYETLHGEKNHYKFPEKLNKLIEEKVIVQEPNGKQHRTTKENAENLPEGWRIVNG
jgi:hypothetical protein